MSYWHAYMAEVPDLTVHPEGNIGDALAFATIGPVPTPEHPDTYEGRVFGHDLTYRYVTTWDHEPTDEEKQQVQPEQYRTQGETEQ